MAFSLGNLLVNLGVDSSGLNRGERRLASFERKTKRHFTNVEAAARRVQRMFAIIVSAEGLRRTAMFADKWTGVNMRIQAATRGSDQFLAVQEEIFAISQRTGAAIDGNAQLFQNLSRVGKDIGATNTEVLKVIESVNQLSVISGTAGRDLQFAMRQFAQGMASGVLRAEEFNSLVENTPELAARLAQGLGYTLGQMRLMVLEGKVLSKDVFASLLKQGDEIAEQFREMPRRLGQSWNVLVNSGMRFLGIINQTQGATEGLGNVMENVAHWLDDRAVPAAFELRKISEEINASLSGWASWIGNANQQVNAATQTFGLLADKGSEFGEFLKKAFIEAAANLQLVSTYIAEEFAVWIARAQGFISEVKIGFQTLWEAVKLGGKLAFLYLEREIAKLIDLIANSLGGTLEKMGKALGHVPGFGDEAKGVAEMADSILAMAGAAADVDKEINKAITSSTKKVDALLKEQAVMEELIDLEIERSEKAVDAAETAALQAQTQIRRELRLAKEKRDADRAAAQEALEKSRQALSNQARPTPAEAPGEDKGAKAAAKERERHQRSFEMLEQSLMREKEALIADHEERMVNLALAEQRGLETKIGFNELKLREQQRFHEEMKEIERKGMEETSRTAALGFLLGVDMLKSAQDLSLREQGDYFTSSISAAAQHSKAFFKLQKALAIAGALVDAPKAILSSYAFGAKIGGPPVGALFAGISAAATAVQVAAIMSAQFTGGRAGGGNAPAGGLMRVNESGPEMLNMGGEQYLMMGNRAGTVSPNVPSAGGAAGAVVVNIHGAEGVKTADATSREEGGQTVVDVFLEQIEQGLADRGERGMSTLYDHMASRFGMNEARGIA